MIQRYRVIATQWGPLQHDMVCITVATRVKMSTLQWRHNEHDGVSNHQPYDRLLNPLFRRRSEKTSKLRVTGLCVGNSLVTGEFPAQRASNAENVSIWWRHHADFQNIWPTADGQTPLFILLFWATYWASVGISMELKYVESSMSIVPQLCNLFKISLWDCFIQQSDESLSCLSNDFELKKCWILTVLPKCVDGVVDRVLFYSVKLI